MQTDIFKL